MAGAQQVGDPCMAGDPREDASTCKSALKKLSMAATAAAASPVEDIFVSTALLVSLLALARSFSVDRWLFLLWFMRNMPTRNYRKHTSTEINIFRFRWKCFPRKTIFLQIHLSSCMGVELMTKQVPLWRIKVTGFLVLRATTDQNYTCNWTIITRCWRQIFCALVANTASITDSCMLKANLASSSNRHIANDGVFTTAMALPVARKSQDVAQNIKTMRWLRTSDKKFFVHQFSFIGCNQLGFVDSNQSTQCLNLDWNIHWVKLRMKNILCQ